MRLRQEQNRKTRHSDRDQQHEEPPVFAHSLLNLNCLARKVQFQNVSGTSRRAGKISPNIYRAVRSAMQRFRSETAAGFAGIGVEDFTDSLMTAYSFAANGERGMSSGM